MKVLFVSHELTAGNLAYLLKEEGCDVKLFINEINLRSNFKNLVKKTSDWMKELNWVGKDGLIVFDDIGYGDLQDKLRRDGYSVFGGSKLGDRLENDRQWSQKIFKKYGLNSLATHNFKSISGAIKFAKKNTGPWVIKQNGHVSKDINYIGKLKDNRDVISLLENYKKHHKKNLGLITLQKRIYGTEIGVGRYFNGHDWIGPIEINIEHKKLFPGNCGPSTSEMGTLAWYDSNEKNKLFSQTLAKLKPFLKKIDFRGDIAVGCIVNKRGAHVLEATARIGTPIIHLQAELHTSPWHKFLKAVADKKKYELQWKKGVGIVVLLACPPFPYATETIKNSPVGLEVFFDKTLSNRDFKHIHFEGISVRMVNKIKKYYVSDSFGYILCVTARGKTSVYARAKIDALIKKIHIPKMFYRNDIGVDFENKHQKILQELDYLN